MDQDNQNKPHFTPEVGRGCGFCNCDSECQCHAADGCFKLHETPWLDEFPENKPTEIVEVRFKNTRRSFYQNASNLLLKTGDIVAVEASPGHDIGVVSLTGDLVAKQMRRTGFNPYNGEFKKIYRKAKPYDIERWQEAIAMEHETMIAARQIAADMGLNMKIGDVEYQGDKIKAIFYYIADERVDFRELIKVFAERFHIRIEMKQIGARQEAGRIGGLGACGRELCCASWISSFSSVTTGAARAQELSLNPQKLAGQCSKLKCCMMYEYDTYVDARKEFPRLREPLQTLDGEFYLVKSDILAGTMTFSSSKEVMSNVTTLPVDRVKEIMALNRQGKKVEQLMRTQDMPVEEDEPAYTSGSDEDSITRFDQAKRRKKNRKGKDKERAKSDRSAQKSAKTEGVAAGTTDAVASEEGEHQRQPKGERGDPSERGERRQRRPRGERPQNAQTGNAPQNTEEHAPRAEGERAEGQRGEGQREGRSEGQREGQPRNNRQRQPRQPRENNGERQPRENGGERQSKPNNNGAESRENREPREPRENREPREPREGRENRQRRPNPRRNQRGEGGEQREQREPRESRGPREQRPRDNQQRGEQQPREPRNNEPRGEKINEQRGERTAEQKSRTEQSKQAPAEKKD